jgi:hypothetical protein
MISQLKRLPAIESHKLELFVDGQAIHLSFWDRAGGSSIFCFTCIGGGEGARFSYSSNRFSDTVCCYAVCG